MNIILGLNTTGSWKKIISFIEYTYVSTIVDGSESGCKENHVTFLKITPKASLHS